jgi:hypothetical protein
MGLPLVLVHGYSDSAKGLKHWSEILIQRLGLNPARVHLINYVTLANEVTIRDIAEGFNHALRAEANIPESQDFDAIVHSTGMLVVRAWLSRYAPIQASGDNSTVRSPEDEQRSSRLRHLVALAPASNGSPVAHKGRSWLGALAKGNRQFGPDFLESGHQVLSALELGSSFTWELAERDLFGDGNTARFKEGKHSPYVFTICGDSGLGGAADLFTGAVGTRIGGSDGVVRWAGAALNSRRLLIDYTGEKAVAAANGKAQPAMIPSDWNNRNNILVLWPGHNHGTIMRPKPDDPLIDLVVKALKVNSTDAFDEWNQEAINTATSIRAANQEQPPDEWQQLVIRVVDERGDGVSDWTISLRQKLKGKAVYEAVKIDDLHPYEHDKSYRCLHLNLKDAGLASSLNLHAIEAFEMKLSMNTGSEYLAYSAQRQNGSSSRPGSSRGLTELDVDLKPYLAPPPGQFSLLMAYTTTFVEFRVNRNPAIKNNKTLLCHVKPPKA